MINAEIGLKGFSMPGKYKVTVVITSYNLGSYMSQCLSDLHHQTFQDFSILIVDDNSIDNTKNIISEWRGIFGERLDVICLGQNLGMPALVRNIALESGKIDGDYIIFLDGDDHIETFFLEILYSLVIEKDADVAICAYDRVDAASGRILSTEMTQFDGMLIEDIFRSDAIVFANTSPWNKMWRTEIIRELRFPAIKVGEEVSFNFRGYAKCRRIAFSGEVLIHYRVRSESVISNTDEECIWKFEKEMRELYVAAGVEEKNVAGLLIFVHIGLSMALRAADDPDIELDGYVKKMRELFKRKYNWFKNNKYLKLSSLMKHGIKGGAIWLAFVGYRINLFGIMLKAYRGLGLDVKF